MPHTSNTTSISLQLSITYDPVRGPYRIWLKGAGRSSYKQQRYIGTLDEVTEKVFADLGKMLVARYRLKHKRQCKFGED